MGATGTIQQNLVRWYGQFKQPDGKATKDVAKVTEKKINNQKVTFVDISGTYLEPIGPPIRRQTVPRPDYRMLAGIVQTKSSGQYFFKLYGPKKTITSAEKHFKTMLESVGSANKKAKPDK